MKWKERNKLDQQLTLKVIENSNKAIKNAFHISQWIIIHQGNDCY